MKALIKLNLRENQLENLPDTVGNLETLRVLDLKSNLLTRLPFSLSQLEDLTSLDVSHNRLTVFPLMLTGLEQLQNLDLSFNRIVGPVPEAVKQMTGLNTLLPHYNALFVEDVELFHFLNNRAGGSDWLRYQVLPPVGLTVRSPDARTVRLSWKRPSSLAGETIVGDTIQVFMRNTTTQEAFVYTGIDLGVWQTEVTISDLDLNTEFEFALRTVESRDDGPLASVFSDTFSSVTAPFLRFFFPLWIADSRLFTGFAVSNPSSEVVQLRFTAFGPDGQLLPLPVNPASFELKAGRHFALLGREIFGGLPEGPAWVLLETDHQDVATLYLVGDFNLTRLDGGSAFTQRLQASHLTRIYHGMTTLQGLPASTHISILNPGDVATQVRLQLYSPPATPEFEEPDKLVVPELIRVLEPFEIWSGRVDEIFDLDQQLETADIQIFGGTIAAAITEFTNSLVVSSGRSLPQSAVSHVAHLASGSPSHGPTVFSNVKMVNRGDHWGTAQVLSRADAGQVEFESDRFGLWPQRSLEADAGLALGIGFPGQTQLTSSSATISFVGSVQIADIFLGAMSDLRFATLYPFAEEGAKRIVFSHLVNTPTVFTGLAIFNPSEMTATISIEIFDATGDLAGDTSVKLPQGGRLAQLVSELISGKQLTGGHIIVSSDAPVVALQIFGDSKQRFLSVVPPG